MNECRPLRAALAATLLVLLLGGCATDRPSKGVEWVESMEAEKRRLTEEGFPQYNGPGN